MLFVAPYSIKYAPLAISGAILSSLPTKFECIPDGAEKSENEIKKAIRQLSSEGYIDVKYSGGNMYCVAPLKRYVNPNAPAQTDEERPKFNNILIFLAACAGGAIGSAAVTLALSLV